MKYQPDEPGSIGAPQLADLPLFCRFDGATYDPTLDQERLTGQLGRVYGVMRGGDWHTLDELVTRCGGTTASVSARLRDLRKSRFGGYTVERRRKTAGVWLYRITATQSRAA